MPNAARATKNERKKLGEILVEAGAITPHQLQMALRSQQEYGGRLGNVLVRLGFISERNLVLYLKKHLDLPGVDLARYEVDPHALALVPKEQAKKFQVLPLSIKDKGGKKHLFLAMSDPTNLEAIDAVQFSTGLAVHPVVAAEGQLGDAIGIYYDGLSRLHVDDFHEEIKLDEKDGGDMIVYQSGTTFDLHGGKLAVDEVEERKRRAARPSGKDDPISRPNNLSPLKELSGAGILPLQGGSDSMKTILALAQLLIDRGIITKKELMDKIKDY